MKISQFIVAAVLLASASFTPAFAQGEDSLFREEGGYVFHGGEARFTDNVWNFIKHFSYDQYFWCEAALFTTSNDSYVDNMDFSYYSGHGRNFYMGMGPSAAVKGVNVGPTTQWGNRDLEFIVFQSCKVVPSPIDCADWYQRWVGATNTFQGLHQAIGYRVNSYSGNGISNNYGGRVRSNQRVWQAWFAAVNDERSWWYLPYVSSAPRPLEFAALEQSRLKGGFLVCYPGYASVVLYPGLDNDRYYSFGGDPPAGHCSLRIYYQH